ncbi:MAG: hypothetical protein ABI263_08255 [Gelidibacter sp.]
MKKNVFIIFISVLMLGCNSDDDNSSLENTCDFISKVISEEDFNAINTSNYQIADVELNNHCLEIKFSSCGCDPELWRENLYSTNSFYTVFPLQRTLKIELINEKMCQAVFKKSISFDLTPFQIDGQRTLPLNIDGWNEQIIYEY